MSTERLLLRGRGSTTHQDLDDELEEWGLALQARELALCVMDSRLDQGIVVKQCLPSDWARQLEEGYCLCGNELVETTPCPRTDCRTWFEVQ